MLAVAYIGEQCSVYVIFLFSKIFMLFQLCLPT